MRTLEIEDELFEKVEAEATRQGITLEELAAKALANAIPKGNRVEFPIIFSGQPGTLKITNEDIRRMEEEDDLRMLGLLDR